MHNMKYKLSTINSLRIKLKKKNFLVYREFLLHWVECRFYCLTLHKNSVSEVQNTETYQLSQHICCDIQQPERFSRRISQGY